MRHTEKDRLSVPYLQSYGAATLSERGQLSGTRLAFDGRYDQAHAWALETFGDEPDRLSQFLCELAMFCVASNCAPAADTYFLEALENTDPSYPSCHAVLAAALAHSLGRLDSEFPRQVLQRLPVGQTPAVTLQLEGQPIALPVHVSMPLAEDLVATIVAVHFSQAHGNSQALLDQLESYLKSVAAADENGVNGGSTPVPHGLAEITLAVLGLIAQMRKRRLAEAALRETSRDIEGCLRRFGEPLDAYPESLANHISKFVSRRYRLRELSSGAAKQPAAAKSRKNVATRPQPGVLHRFLGQVKSLMR